MDVQQVFEKLKVPLRLMVYETGGVTFDELKQLLAQESNRIGSGVPSPVDLTDEEVEELQRYAARHL